MLDSDITGSEMTEIMAELTGDDGKVRGILCVVAEDLARIRTLLGRAEAVDQQFQLRRRQTDRLFDLSPDPLVVASFDGHVSQANPAFLHLFGWSRQALTSAPFVDFVHPEDLPVLSTALQKMASGQRVVNYELRFKAKDNSYRWLRGAAQPALEEGLIHAVATDVTERKRREQILTLSEAQLAESQRIARVGSWQWDILNDTTTWSEELIRMFGLASGRTPVTFQTYLELLDPQDRDAAQRAIAGALQDRESFSFDHRIINPEAGTRFVHAAGRVIVDRTGQPVSMIGTAQDVTDLLAGERARARLAAIVESSADAILSCDLKGTVTSWNPAAAALLGWTAEQAVGGGLSRLALSELEPGQPGVLEPAGRGLAVGPVDVFVRHEDGRRVEVSLVASPIFSDEKARGCSITLRDVGERRRAEALMAIDNEVLAMVATDQTVNRILETLLEKVEQLLPGTFASILVTDADRAHLRHAAAPSLPDAYIRAVDGIAIGPAVGSCGTAAHRGEMVVVEDVMTDPLWADFKDLASSHGLRSCWSAPIFTAGQQVGGTFALYHRQPRRPSKQDVQLIDSVTHLARLAIEHHRTKLELSESRSSLREAQAIAQIGNWEFDPAAGTMSWSEELFNILGLKPASTHPGYRALINSFAQHQRPQIQTALDEAIATGSGFELEHDVIRPDGQRRVVHTRVRVVEGEAGHRRVLGTEQDITGLKLKEQALEQSRETARYLQQSLLPESLPLLPGMAVAGRYLAGAAGVEVGGDWYDVFSLPSGMFAFAVGDVVGRGIVAAATMGQLRSALRAYALSDPSPGAVLSQLNKLVETMGRGQMATAVYAVVDPVAGKIRMASAGHPPALVISPNGQSRYIDQGRGPLLGVPSYSMPETQFILEPGSTLLLYTDGLVERRAGTLDEGFEALQRAASAGATDPEELCNRVLAEMLGQNDCTDDVALLALFANPLDGGLFRMAAPAEPEILRSLRQGLAGWLENAGCPGQDREDIVLACNEAAANVIEHAYGPGGGLLEVTCSVKETQVELIIKDFGDWRTRERGAGGRGLGIIQALMESVEIIHSSSGTEVRLGRRLGVDPQGATGVLIPCVELPAGNDDLVTVVSLAEQADLANLQHIEEGLVARVSNDSLGLVLDLCAQSYLDSAGIRLLHHVAARLRVRRQRLVVVLEPASQLRRLLRMVDPEGFIPLFESAQQAREHLLSGAGAGF